MTIVSFLTIFLIRIIYMIDLLVSPFVFVFLILILVRGAAWFICKGYIKEKKNVQELLKEWEKKKKKEEFPWVY